MKRAALIVNPTKIKHLPRFKREVESVMHGYAWAAPVWLHTSIEDPGFGQTRIALQEKVDLIGALGGDGTVRNVASEMLHTGVPLTILPAGTGNLLARNLGLPTGNWIDAIRVALNGRNREIDTLSVQIDTTGDGEFDDVATCTVMTGCGLDAEIMNNTSEKLKARASWLAYPLAGLREVRAARTPMRVAIDDEPLRASRDLTTVLIGNCGRLTGGIRLMPEALPDDGVLDVIELSARNLTWARLVSQVLRGSTKDTAQVRRATGTKVRIECGTPTRVEIDGEVHDHAHAVRVTMQPKSLLVRVP